MTSWLLAINFDYFSGLLKVLGAKSFYNWKGITHSHSGFGDSLHAMSYPGVNSLRSLKKSLILFIHNKQGEISARL